MMNFPSKKQQTGFTLIEIIIFIAVTAILASTILLAVTTSLQKTTTVHGQMLAALTAEKCMEWFIGQRRSNGYSAIGCPSTTVPSFCSAPSGYSVAVNISCTTINNDANYQTIAITVSGSGYVTLTSMIAAY